MRAFEVHLNGEKLCVAGMGEDGVLTAIVTWVKGNTNQGVHLQVGGLISETREHIAWIEQKRIGIGDEIQIKVMEANSIDEPTRRNAAEKAKAVEDRKNYIRSLSMRLGITIEGELRETG